MVPCGSVVYAGDRPMLQTKSRRAHEILMSGRCFWVCLDILHQADLLWTAKQSRCCCYPLRHRLHSQTSLAPLLTSKLVTAIGKAMQLVSARDESPLWSTPHTFTKSAGLNSPHFRFRTSADPLMPRRT